MLHVYVLPTDLLRCNTAVAITHNLRIVNRGFILNAWHGARPSRSFTRVAAMPNNCSWLHWLKTMWSLTRDGGWAVSATYLQHSQSAGGVPGGLHAVTHSEGVKSNPDIVYAVSDVKATYCRVQCLTVNLQPRPLKRVHISASWHYRPSLAPSPLHEPQQLILQLDRLCFHVGGSF